MIANDQETWERLPAVVQRGAGPLPAWAKRMATQLPRTTAAMLCLDYVHRTNTIFDPRLRAKMRLVIAHANRCQYAIQCAAADCQRAGGTDDDIQEALASPEDWSGAARHALRFAFEHTRHAPQIEDQLFEHLRREYGDKSAAAMVLSSAYGNFQDRILLGLGVQQEQVDPLPPLAVEFAAEAFQTRLVLPVSSPPPEPLGDGKNVVDPRLDIPAASLEQLRRRMEGQLRRRQRLPTPSWENLAPRLPPELSAHPIKIVWNLVCLGYVPELAIPWSRTTRTMWAEAPQDRVFEESLFWLQTRALECNYCMGHCEMLLEVAGLDQGQVDRRLQRLAGADWSSFPEQEQRTFAYAWKLTTTPWELTETDYAQLEDDHGPKNALAIFFWLCRGLYMTRVSDGFQLQLEADNVFADLS